MISHLNPPFLNLPDVGKFTLGEESLNLYIILIDDEESSSQMVESFIIHMHIWCTVDTIVSNKYCFL